MRIPCGSDLRGPLVSSYSYCASTLLGPDGAVCGAELYELTGRGCPVSGVHLAVTAHHATCDQGALVDCAASRGVEVVDAVVHGLDSSARGWIAALMVAGLSHKQRGAWSEAAWESWARARDAASYGVRWEEAIGLPLDSVRIAPFDALIGDYKPWELPWQPEWCIPFPYLGALLVSAPEVLDLADVTVSGEWAGVGVRAVRDAYGAAWEHSRNSGRAEPRLRVIALPSDSGTGIRFEIDSLLVRNCDTDLARTVTDMLAEEPTKASGRTWPGAMWNWLGHPGGAA